jgi:hypothetical protein
MNISAIITLMKLFEGAGLTKRAPQDPSSKTGLRPTCGLGEEAYYDHNIDEYRCRLKFK